MKLKSLLILILLMGPIYVLAQTVSDPEQSRNELKVNMLYVIAEVPEITYERLLSEDGAFGVSVGFAIDDEIDYELGIIPYYRFYFGNGYAQGFFLEANTFVGSYRDYFYNFTNDVEEFESRFAFGVGIAAGAKFLTSKEWIGEIYVGLGRFFTDAQAIDFGYPRVGIVFGKRW